MNELRFDDRVAIVTGAGRGLGRAYALLLAERGATVVVNDLGTSMSGSGADEEPAGAVAAEVAASGGTALADGHDVSSPANAQALVDATLEQFGRLDIVINNAGVISWADFPDTDDDNFGRHLAVHLGGSFLVTRAVWPHLVKQQYGRVVMTTSSGIFGLPNNSSYAAAKAGVVGLTRSLATAGAPYDVRVNAIAPAAMTRMAGPVAPDLGDRLDPALVAPMAAYLAHETCPVTGEIYAAGAGRFARILLAQTPGYVHPGTPTIEDLADQWPAINDERGFTVPADLMSWSAGFLTHLSPTELSGDGADG
jgi:NAD(P)-dependent dehydrogenase (short-subunit alcohol dehydrogenase family)